MLDTWTMGLPTCTCVWPCVFVWFYMSSGVLIESTLPTPPQLTLCRSSRTPSINVLHVEFHWTERIPSGAPNHDFQFKKESKHIQNTYTVQLCHPLSLFKTDASGSLLLRHSPKTKHVPFSSLPSSPVILLSLFSLLSPDSWVSSPDSWVLRSPESSSRNFPRLWVFSKNFIELRPTKFTDFSTLAWNWNLLPHFTSVTRVRATNPASSGRMSDKQSQRIGKQAIYCMPIFVYFWGIFSIFWTLSSFAFSSTPLPPKFPVW